MKTEELLSSAGETFEYARMYLEQKGDYLHLEASKRVAKTTSNLVTLAVIAFLSFMVILFLTLSIGFFLGSMWGSYGLSFLIITVFYAITAIVIFIFKKQFITNPIIALMVKHLLN